MLPSTGRPILISFRGLITYFIAHWTPELCTSRDSYVSTRLNWTCRDVVPATAALILLTVVIFEGETSLLGESMSC